MLIDKQNREHFKGMTRQQIEHTVGERNVARALTPLSEVLTTNNKFPLGQIARIKQ